VSSINIALKLNDYRDTRDNFWLFLYRHFTDLSTKPCLAYVNSILIIKHCKYSLRCNIYIYIYIYIYIHTYI